MDQKSNTQQPFAEMQQAVQEAGQAMRAQLLEQMQHRGHKDYAQGVHLLADNVEAQMRGFVDMLSQSVQEQVTAFVNEAQASRTKGNGGSA